MANLMRSSQVAELFGVDKHTVGRWANSGKIAGLKTPGGHWRFHPDYIASLIAAAFNPENGDG